LCGFAGFLRDPHQPRAEDKAVLRAMLAPIAIAVRMRRNPCRRPHRLRPSPPRHHRSHGGHQPRIDPLTGDALIYNGEIYGFAALAAELVAAGSISSTVAIPRCCSACSSGTAWRDPEKIDGMFTFAFYEAKTGNLHLARDRFGEKPLYYAEPNGTFVFASEPRAVLAHPACRDLPVDPGAVASFLAFEYLPGQNGLRRGLKKLPAGHVLTHAKGRSEIRCYWRPNPDEDGAARVGESEGQRLERLEGLLDAGVRDRLIADVPVGVFLSGGIDSSLIAAFVARHAPGLTALTVAVPGASYDETPAAKALARSLGLTHEVVALDEPALLDAFQAVTAQMDEPLADSRCCRPGCSAARPAPCDRGARRRRGR
jgi:asparagine synthase (glutamine-hydrolysing)